MSAKFWWMLTSDYVTRRGDVLNPNLKRFVFKYFAGRVPIIRDLVLPKHRFGVDPIQLAALVNLIDATRESGGAVCEIGIGMGHTSVFLLEHMRSTANPAKVVLVDTFEGFTESSISYEVTHRGKVRSDIDLFKYGSRDIFERRLRRLGYDGFKIIVGDCQKVNWESIGPIAVALIDVDFYLPTKHTLDHIWPLIVPGGGCLVDDCKEGGPWDGALQAYSEFIEDHRMPFIHVGRKGGLLKKYA